MDAGLLDAVRTLVADLARGRYAELEADGRAGRLTAAELASAIQEYGRTLLPLPDEAIPLIDVFVHLQAPNTTSVDVPMWTVEEGRSDLTLSVEARRDGGTHRVAITDLHVL